MLKISRAGCHGLSPAISSQFILKMYVITRNHEKFSLIWLFKVVQGN